MFNKVTPNQQLDFVFFYIKKRLDTNSSVGYNNIWNYVKLSPEMGINNIMLNNALDQLENVDKLIKRVNIINQQDIFHITHEGMVFRGYVYSNRWWRKPNWNIIIVILTIIGLLLSYIGIRLTMHKPMNPFS